jgi:hypothetical protein
MILCETGLEKMGEVYKGEFGLITVVDRAGVTFNWIVQSDEACSRAINET